MQVKASEATKMIEGFIQARLVPLIIGSPGIGKSDIVRQIAKKFNLQVIDLRLSQCDPCDLAGFPSIVNGKADYAPMKHFPIEGDPIPKGMDGWLLFLDEITSAAPSIQAASYKLILDRMVGSHHLHKNVAIVAAGNRDTDNAIVQPMSTALQSRLVHLDLMIDYKEWCIWATEANLTHKIIDYIRFKPQSLYTFKPDHSDKTYACPRTWEFADRIIKKVGLDYELIPQMLAGTLSEGVAREFLTYCKIYADLPKMTDIIDNPTGVTMSKEPSVLYALTGAISNTVSMENFEKVFMFVERMPAEFQIITLKNTLHRNPTIDKHPSMGKWYQKLATSLI